MKWSELLYAQLLSPLRKKGAYFLIMENKMSTKDWIVEGEFVLLSGMDKCQKATSPGQTPAEDAQ